MDYLNNLKQGLQNDTVTIDRLDDAVMRILAVKMAFGLVKPKKAQHEQSKELRSEETHRLNISEQKSQQISNEYLDSIKAVHESMVLLKNEHSLIPVEDSHL